MVTVRSRVGIKAQLVSISIKVRVSVRLSIHCEAISADLWWSVVFRQTRSINNNSIIRRRLLFC